MNRKVVVYAACASMFVIGLVSFSQTQTVGVEPASSYSVITVHYRVNPDGSKTNQRERIRYVKANGEFRQLHYDPKNPSDEIPAREAGAVFAGTTDGVYATAPSQPERKAISGAPDDRMKDCFRSVKCLRSQLSFVRIDHVAGLEVYVLRTNVEQSGHPMEWLEDSYSPKTGYIPLRTVTHFRDGSETVMEATKVRFMEIPENLNDDIKLMPTKN